MSDSPSFLSEVAQIFRDVLSTPDLQLRPEMTAQDVDGWDSFAHMSLLMGIEKKFKVKFTLKEVVSFKTVGDLLNLLQAKLTHGNPTTLP